MSAIQEYVRVLPRPIPRDVKGFMSEWELQWLYTMAKELGDKGVVGDLLEVGSYKGLSACALGQAGRLTCVDTFRGGEDLPYEDTEHEFRRNIARLDLDMTVRVFRGRSDDVLSNLLHWGERFRLVFIDGSHEFRTVRDDLIAGQHLTSPGGVVVADDYVGFPGVKMACDNLGGFKRVAFAKSKMAYWVNE